MSQPRYREITTSSMLFGLAIGVIMNASITYAGLKIGFTIGGSAIAAVLGFGFLRGILRRGTILETNTAQTIASAVNVPNSGVIFTVPVLYLLAWKTNATIPKEILSLTHPTFWLLTLACVVGAILGCAFIIPVRKQMIDIDRLRFPSGTAVAAILKAPGAGAKKSIVLLSGAIVAAAVYAPVALPSITVEAPPEELEPLLEAGLITDKEAEEGRRPLWGYSNLNWRLPEGEDQAARERADRDGDGRPDLILTNDMFDLGRWLGLPDYLMLVFAITPLSLGAGYITGRPGLMVLAGGVLAYFILNPAAYYLGLTPASVEAASVPGYAYGAFNRPLGIGLLVGGAIMGVLFSLPAIKAALGSIASAAAKSSAGSDELGFKVLFLAALLACGGLYLAADFARTGGGTGLLGPLDPHLQSLIIALVGAVWIWFAGIIIAQCTGMTDWSPISGMALLTVVLVMLLGGKDDVVGAVLIGAALCVAVTCAADMMTDLRTGHLLGAIPRRQQTVELLFTGIGPLVTMATIVLVVQSNLDRVDIPLGPGTETTAPQAQALEAVITGVQGGEMPYALYAGGGLLGIAVGLGSFPGLGVLVGLSMYLPIFYILTYGVGCLLNMLVVRLKGKVWSEEWGVPFCAGLIVGEAILALVVNAIVLIPGSG